MSEFHEVECPEHIGRVSGCGRIPSILLIEFPPLMWGMFPSNVISIPICYSKSNKIIVEYYCIIIINYGWQVSVRTLHPVLTELLVLLKSSVL